MELEKFVDVVLDAVEKLASIGLDGSKDEYFKLLDEMIPEDIDRE